MNKITTFIIPTIGRDTLQRALNSVPPEVDYLYLEDKLKQGASTIRNQLILSAQTEWVSMLDDDDTVTSDYVQRLREEIAAHPDAELILFREYFISELMNDSYPDHFIWQAPVVHWGQIGIAFSVKRELALKFPFINQANEDFHFVSRIDQAGHNIHFSKYMVYRARH